MVTHHPPVELGTFSWNLDRWHLAGIYPLGICLKPVARADGMCPISGGIPRVQGFTPSCPIEASGWLSWGSMPLLQAQPGGRTCQCPQTHPFLRPEPLSSALWRSREDRACLSQKGHGVQGKGVQKCEGRLRGQGPPAQQCGQPSQASAQGAEWLRGRVTAVHLGGLTQKQGLRACSALPKGVGQKVNNSRGCIQGPSPEPPLLLGGGTSCRISTDGLGPQVDLRLALGFFCAVPIASVKGGSLLREEDGSSGVGRCG